MEEVCEKEEGRRIILKIEGVGGWESGKGKEDEGRIK